jgi:hypothetical protein
MIEVYLRRKYRDLSAPTVRSSHFVPCVYHLSLRHLERGSRLAQALTRAVAHTMVNADNSILPPPVHITGRLDQRSQKKPRDTQRGRVQGKAS